MKPNGKPVTLLLLYGGILTIDLWIRELCVTSGLLPFSVNTGFAGGVFADAAPVLRIGFHLGYFFSFSVLYLYFFQWSGSWRWIHAFYLGFATNLAERIARGGVIDYLPVPGLNARVNAADLLQLASIAALVVTGVRQIRSTNPNANDRRLSLLADQRIQLRLFSRVSAVFAGFCAAVLTMLAVSRVPGAQALSWVVAAYAVLFEAVLFCVLLGETNRIVGPVRAFLRYMESAEPPREFKIRESDEFAELQTILRPDDSRP